MKKNHPRAIRFNSEDNQIIETFLDKNPAFDFSLLARLAILRFIEDPILKIQPVASNFKENLKRIVQEDRELLDSLANDDEDTKSRKVS